MDKTLISIELPLADWQFIGSVLGKIPYEQVAELIQKLGVQLDQKLKAMQQPNQSNQNP